jgi:hypothetical protein
MSHEVFACRWLPVVLAAAMLAGVAHGCFAGDGATERKRLFIIGQDLGSVRDYQASGCCPQADANTMYLNFYALTSEEGGFGGLGIDLEGEPIDREFDWGAGMTNAWKSATEFEGGLAIGLSMTENDNPDGLARIVAGEFDHNIRQLARFFSLINEPVYLRIGYEFDGGWNKGYEDPEKYVAAYRRIVDGLRAENADNVQFVWQSAAFPLDILNDGGYTDIRQWYPGDEYVDWMGLSLFLLLDEGPGIETDFEPPTARQLIGKVLELAREQDKPVFIGEASPQGYDLARNTNANIAATWDGPQGEGRRKVSPEEIWDEWFAPVFEFLEENRDVIYALAYINCNWDSQDMWDAPYESGYWGDSRLQVSPLLAERFTEAIERWRGGE